MIYLSSLVPFILNLFSLFFNKIFTDVPVNFCGYHHTTYEILLDILNDELEHEEDLENFLEDMEYKGK